jgi:large subunit ribosomal protein L28
MTRKCSLSGKTKLVGNLVSHSNRKNKRTFLPNLQMISLMSDKLKQSFQLRIATNTLRTIDSKGGLDEYLTMTANKDLTPEAIQLKKKIKKAATVAQA